MTFHLIRFLTSAICQKVLQCLINVIFSIHEFDFGHNLETSFFEMSIHATIYNKIESFRSAFKSKLTIEYRVSADYCSNICHCYKILPTWDSLQKNTPWQCMIISLVMHTTGIYFQHFPTGCVRYILHLYIKQTSMGVWQGVTHTWL